MFNSPTLAQNLVGCLVVAYVAFCIFYGHASLKARRTAVPSSTDGSFRQSASLAVLAQRAGFLTRLACVLLAPVLLLATVLSFSGRERSGVVESSGLFTVPTRSDASLAFLAKGDVISAGQVVARFASEALEHRIAGLRAKRQELVASRSALQSSALPLSADDFVKLQAAEQRLAQLQQKLADLDRQRFSARQQLFAGHAAWARARGELVARLPQLEQALTAGRTEREMAERAYERIKDLRERGYATVTQLDQVTVAATAARQRLNSTQEALASTRQAIATLDDGHARTRELLEHEIGKLTTETETIDVQRALAETTVASLGPALDGNRSAAIARRNHEIAAASARIDELDNEIAAAVAQMQVKSPIGGRVLYRNTATTTLNGSLPLLVVASREGFLMRIDMVRDEIAALERDAAEGQSFDVVVDDRESRRLVRARLVRIDDNGFDPKRVTAVFGLELPEEMLVRMALKGTSPRGSLRWAPPALDVVSTRVVQALGFKTDVPGAAVETRGDTVETKRATDRRPIAIERPISL